MKRFAASALLILLSVSLLISCGKQNPEGKYVVKSIDGKTIEQVLTGGLEEAGLNLQVYMDLIGITSVDEYMVMELKPGGIATMDMPMLKEPLVGTWEWKGEKLLIDLQEYPAEFSFRGGELVATLGTHYYVFVKK